MVFFRRSRYNVKESEGLVKLELTLSNPSSFNISIILNETGNTAENGK